MRPLIPMEYIESSRLSSGSPMTETNHQSLANMSKVAAEACIPGVLEKTSIIKPMAKPRKMRRNGLRFKGKKSKNPR